MNPQILNVAFEDGVDAEAVNELKSALVLFGDDVDFHEFPEKGPQLSILLLGMSSIALIFGGAFVKKLGDKAAEDAYPHIKNGLCGVYKKYFGKNPMYRMKIIATSENKAPDVQYSLFFAMYCVGKNNERVKFLYKNDWSEEQFNNATEIYLSAMCSFVNKGDGDVSKLLMINPSRTQPALISWDETANKLEKVSAFPEHVCI